MHLLTNEQILSEIKKLPENERHPFIMSCDMVRLAYEWIDAQVKLKHPNKRPYLEKHIVERWAGRYISASAVEVAGRLHPDIIGSYPCFNVGRRFVYPNKRRQINIPEAGIHPNYLSYVNEDNDIYFYYEA